MQEGKSKGLRVGKKEEYRIEDGRKIRKQRK